MNMPISFSPDPWTVLSGSSDDASFHAAWLGCLVAGLGEGVTEAVLVLGKANQGPYHPVAQWPRPGHTHSDVAAVCEQALEMRIPLSLARERQMLALPLLHQEDLYGVVAVAFSAAPPRGAMNWLRWGQGWLDAKLAQDETGEADALRERLLTALDLVMLALGENRSLPAAQAVVTEAAVRLGADRVAVGFERRGTMKLFALSHSADVARRIDLAEAIEAAMNEALDQRARIELKETAADGSLDADDTGRDRHAHLRLRREFGSGAVLSVPFASRERDDVECGVFVFEWAEGAQDEDALRMAEALAPILGRVLLDKRCADRPWPERALASLRAQWRHLVGPRYGGRKLGFALLLLAVVFFANAYGDYRISAKSYLEGGVRRVIVAPYDGFVLSAKARAGHVVESGEELAMLDDRDMKLEASRWASQQKQYLKQSDDAQAQYNLAQIQISRAQARQAAAQRELSEAMLRRARVVAPFAGIIVSGDLSQHLDGAVRKGQTLFEIAPLKSYRVVLEVDEADIARVDVGQGGELMVAALPGETFPFRVSLVTPVASSGEGRNHFRIEATLEEATERLRPGMEGIGKVEVGRERLIWIWTHRMLDWARLQAWTWLGL